MLKKIALFVRGGGGFPNYSLPCHQLSHSELLCFGIGHNLPFLGESETELAQLDPLWRCPHVSESKWIRWASRVKNIKLLAVVFVFLQDHLKTSILGKSMLKVRSLSVSSPHRTDALILIGAAVPWKNLHVHGFVNKVNSVQKRPTIRNHSELAIAPVSDILWMGVAKRCRPSHFSSLAIASSSTRPFTDRSSRVSAAIDWLCLSFFSFKELILVTTGHWPGTSKT